MKAFFKSVLDLVLYSSFLISLAAALFTLETYHLLNLSVKWPYIWLVFFSTTFIYSLHRLIGINLVHNLNISHRFQLIKKYKNALKLYGALAFISCLILVFNLDIQTLLILMPAGIISLLYVTPVYKKKRVRDLNFIKIFLIAFNWMYISVAVPVLSSGLELNTEILLAAFEKFTFILAITVPFDVRDKEADSLDKVKTIASEIGLKKSYLLTSFLLVIGYGLFYMLLKTLDLDERLFLHVSLAYILTFCIVFITYDKKSDYYFSGLLDGSIIIRSLLIILPFLV